MAQLTITFEGALKCPRAGPLSLPERSADRGQELALLFRVVGYRPRTASH